VIAAIPAMRPNTGWRDVPIDPVDEALVRVAEIGGRVHDDPAYARWGVPHALSEGLVREGVAERLERVAQALPDGRSLVVWDGFRPLSVQTALYRDWEWRLRRDHPEWDEARIAAQAARFVTPPSEDPDAPPPHLSGGAVDLTLGDGDGRPLDLGTDFDAFVDDAHALALEGRPGPAREHRRLLYWAMASEGFVGYVEEWWHYDFGDQFWGLVRGERARYGPASHVASRR